MIFSPGRHLAVYVVCVACVPCPGSVVCACKEERETGLMFRPKRVDVG